MQTRTHRGPDFTTVYTMSGDAPQSAVTTFDDGSAPLRAEDKYEVREWYEIDRPTEDIDEN